MCFWECFIWSDGQDCKCVIVFLCVCVCVCICRLWWWSCSDQPLLSNQPPAVSSLPTSSTFAGKPVNVELSGQEGLSIHRKHKTSTAWFSCCIFVPVTHGKNPSLSTAAQRLETDSPNNFLQTTNATPKQQTDTDQATVSFTEARVSARPLESHHHSIYTTCYVLNWVSIRWQWLLLGVVWGWSFIIVLVQRDKWKAICQL